MTDQPTGPETLGASLIKEVLAKRDDPAQSGWAASIRRGITASTEIGAYGYTERHLCQITSDQVKVGIRRAAAICASARGSANGGFGIGKSLAKLAGVETAESIERKVNILPMLDVENAALSLSSLVGRCSDRGISVDFYSLADLLARWGNGITPASRKARQRIVADYYSAPVTD